MTQIENEQKFLLLALPPNFGRLKFEPIEQHYITAPPDPLRPRRKGARFFLTQKTPLKGGDRSRQLEDEMEISQQKFRRLIKLSLSRIDKRRHYGPLAGDRVGEYDFFFRAFRGLAWVEVEHESDKKRKKFRPPPWFGREITDEPWASNSYLAFQATSLAAIVRQMRPDDLLWFNGRPCRAADWLARQK